MPPLERAQATLTALTEGDVEVLGRLPWSSNATLLTRLCHQGEELLAVYKPGQGERRLWDFPPAIYRREEAAYLLSAHLGWDLVPETVLRDGPYGEGSFQRFVEADHEHHYFTLLEDPANHDRLRALAVFDVLTNQADRKGGHVLAGADGRIWAVDNGLSFHVELKLRTVIWDFAGQPVPADLEPGLRRVSGGDLPAELHALLDPDEVGALRARAAELVDDGVLPELPWGQYSYPWPLV